MSTQDFATRDQSTNICFSSGLAIISASSVSVVIAITWGGVKFPWSSARVLAPLILGLVGLAGFFLYEATLAPNPVVSALLSFCCSLSLILLWIVTRCPSHSFQTEQVSVGKFHLTILSGRYDKDEILNSHRIVTSKHSLTHSSFCVVFVRYYFLKSHSRI